MFIFTLAYTSLEKMSVILNRRGKKQEIQATWIQKIAINEIEFNLMQLWVHMGIRFHTSQGVIVHFWIQCRLITCLNWS